MKKLIIIIAYYLATILPLVAIIYGLKDNPTAFVICLLLYIVYRPLLDAYKLISKGIIAKKDWLKMYNPWFSRNYFRELYLS